MGGFAYATVNGVNVTFTVSSETLYKVALTVTNCTAKLGTTTVATGDVVYAGTTGVTLTVTPTSGTLTVVAAGNCQITAAGLVTATADGTLTVACIRKFLTQASSFMTVKPASLLEPRHSN